MSGAIAVMMMEEIENYREAKKRLPKYSIGGIDKWIIEVPDDGLPEYKPTKTLDKIINAVWLSHPELKHKADSQKEYLMRIFGLSGYKNNRPDTVLDLYENGSEIIARGKEIELHFDVKDLGTHGDVVYLHKPEFYQAHTKEVKGILPVRKRVLSYREARKPEPSVSPEKKIERAPIIEYV